MVGLASTEDRKGENKVVTRCLLFWHATTMTVGCENILEEGLSLCACFAQNVQTWKVCESLFLAPLHTLIHMCVLESSHP